MDVRGEMTIALAAMILIIIIVSLGAIGLFGRMAPTIEQILQENDYSLQAGERMLAVLAEAPADSTAAARRGRFESALANARRNVTEQEEVAELDIIETRSAAALDGDPRAAAAVGASLQRLADINRAAMRRVDAEARRLGTGGAWAAALMGLLGFAIGLIVLARVRIRLLDPLNHVRTVLARAMEGDVNRRCTVTSSSRDIAFVMRAINELLDKYSREAGPSDRDLEHCYASQTVLAWMLDRSGDARLLVDSEGSVVSASSRAIAALEGERGDEVREALAAGPDEVPPGLRAVERFPDVGCVLYELEA